MRLAYEAFQQGAIDDARRLAEQSIELSRRHGFARNEVHILSLQGELELETGDEDRGVALVEESADRAATIGFAFWEMVTTSTLASSLLARGRTERAVHWALRSLDVALRIGDRTRVLATLLQLARAAAQDRDAERAGLLWAAVEVELEREPAHAWTARGSVHAEEVLAVAGPDFKRGQAAGRLLALDEAVAIARAGVHSPSID